MQKILIVRVSSLGDVVHNMPVIADIRRRFPDAQIDWLVEESFASLVELVSGVHRAIPFSLRRWRKRWAAADNWREIGKFKRELAAEKYDLVIDCQGLIKTAWVASWARGPLVGLGNRTDGAGYEWPVRFFYDRRVPIEPRTHVVERSRQLVAAALDLSKPHDDIDFGIDTWHAALAVSQLGLNLPVPYVVFVHATSRADKQWPEAAWIELGQALVTRGASIVLPWGNAAERATSEKLAREFGAAAIVPPKLSLPAVVGLIDGAAATVGVDSGLVHIAAALKRPTVELYNFSTAWRTGGYWSPNVINLGDASRHPTLSEVKSALASFGCYSSPPRHAEQTRFEGTMTESQIIEVASCDWQGKGLSVPRETLLTGVEDGKVLYFPNLRFAIEGGEQALLDPAIADPKRKNISLAPNGSALNGVLGDNVMQSAVRSLIKRYQDNARSLVDGLFPEYDGKLRVAPTSLRLHQVETREASWRKDDSRLHVDAFPSRPNYSERILRVFTNINPQGAPRVWRVGEPFEDMAKRFLPEIKAQAPGSAWLMNLLQITKTPRSEYDHLMLHLHDAMKADLDYQKTSPQETIPFPPGSVWVCFSDQTSHAVMSGQFMMEQTFFLPVKSMACPDHAPLGILEHLKGRVLV